MAKFPFILSRDNTGLILVNVRSQACFTLTEAALTANLFGHGDILKVI